MLVVLLGVWLWRKNRAAERSDAMADSESNNRAPAGRPQIMISCAVCGVHLPLSDAVAGAAKHYCSLAHRQQREP